MPLYSDGRWYLLADAQIARYLGPEREGSERTKRLAATIGEVFHELKLRPVEPRPEDTSLGDALAHLEEDPVLLVHRAGQRNALIGLVTAFDLL